MDAWEGGIFPWADYETGWILFLTGGGGNELPWDGGFDTGRDNGFGYTETESCGWLI